MQLRICAGATIIPVFIVPNEDMASDTSTGGHRKIPFIIGDLKEGVKFFDRNLMSIMTSEIADIGDLNAFEEDLTIFRAIEREEGIIPNLAIKDLAKYIDEIKEKLE